MPVFVSDARYQGLNVVSQGMERLDDDTATFLAHVYWLV
jgi:hypothetical protein